MRKRNIPTSARISNFCRETVHRDWVNRIHCFNYAATMSHGPISGDIPAISLGAERTARGVVNALFAEDYQRTWQRLTGWSNPELRGDEYVLDEDVSKFLADEPAEAKT